MMKNFLIILLVAGLETACDKTVTLSVNEGESKEIEFSCGSVSITAMKSFAPGYTITHRFTLIKPIALYFDSLKIEHNGNPLSFEITDETGAIIKERSIAFEGQKVINVYIAKNLDEGAILLADLKGFMICDGASVYNDKLTVQLQRE